MDERINYVATKVIHVGDQLESINTPRSRAVQVHKLIGYLEEFMTAGSLSVDIFNDPTKVRIQNIFKTYLLVCYYFNVYLLILIYMHL